MPITQPSTGNLVLLSTTTLGGDATSISISGLSVTSYKYLYILLDFWSSSANGNDLRIRFNNSAANYAGYLISAAGGAATAAAANGTEVTLFTTTINGQPTKGLTQCIVSTAADSGNSHYFQAIGGGDKQLVTTTGNYTDANPITRVDALVTFGTLKAGCRMTIWGIT